MIANSIERKTKKKQTSFKHTDGEQKHLYSIFFPTLGVLGESHSLSFLQEA